MKTILLSVILSALTLTAMAAPPSAEQILTEARTKATAERKTIYVHFGASRCGWCKRLDTYLEEKEIKPVFEKYFIPVKLVVQENEKNKALENAGAETVLKRLGGPAGLPYSAFLNAQGGLIVNSNRNGEDGQNIGYPSAASEIDWFVEMVKKAAPKIAAEDLKILESELRRRGK